MKRILITVAAIAGLFMSVFATTSMAGVGIGVSGNVGLLSTSGTETLKSTSVKVDHSEKEAALIPAVFLQYDVQGSGWVVGVDYTPVSADLGDKAKQRNHMTNPAGDVTLVTQKAQAELRDHARLYVETPGFFGENSQSGLYAGIGYSRVTVETNESLGTGSTYGNKKVNGTTYEVGYKQKFDNGYLIKIAGNYTDYGHVTLTGSADNATPVGQRNIIDADTEVYGVKLSVGYQF